MVTVFSISGSRCLPGARIKIDVEQNTSSTKQKQNKAFYERAKFMPFAQLRATGLALLVVLGRFARANRDEGKGRGNDAANCIDDGDDLP